MVTTATPVYSTVLSILACLIPPYALRLTRAFGTKRVGWVIFSAFVLLGALQLLRAWHPLGWQLDAERTLDILYLVVPVMLLIGMLHIETVFKERLKVEDEEKRVLAELETQVQERTVELNTANDELQREISLRKQGEQELRKSKEAYRFLFDENPLPMWIFDLESLRFLAFNNAAVRLYGFSHARFRQLSPAELYAPEQVEAFLEDCHRSSGQERSVWRHLKKDGTALDVELTTHDLVYGERKARLVVAYELSPRSNSESQRGVALA